MSLTSADIRHLASMGLTAEQLAAVAEIVDGHRPQTSSGAERTRRYRERQASQNVTSDVTSDVTRDGIASQSVTGDVTNPPSPSPPPLSPLHPPLPAPTPTPTPTKRVRMREGRGGKTGTIESEIAGADEEPLPLELMLPAFRDVWADWCLHRAELYRANPAKRWTALAARKTLTECARHGAELSAMAITAAISNGWQGLVWDRLQYSPNHSPNGQHRTTNRPALTRNAEPLLAGQPSLNTSGNCGGGRAGTVSGVQAPPGPSLDENGEYCW